MQSGTLDLTVHGASVKMAYLRREGGRAPLVCLHGFGSTKEDYADLALYPAFEGRDLVLLDAPGCGASIVDNPDVISIPFLIDSAIAACDALWLTRFHLSGHYMGGLTALLLAHANRDRVLSFIDIEGNVAPEDCFLSRQVVQHATEDAEDFLQGFIERVSQRPEYASGLYTVALPLKVRPDSVRPIFSSMVELSDNAPLLDMISGLACPRVFIHGDQNHHLSYREDLPALGVEVREIPFSGHFPMYSNPPALWATMSDFLSRTEDRV